MRRYTYETFGNSASESYVAPVSSAMRNNHDLQKSESFYIPLNTIEKYNVCAENFATR